MGLIKAIAGAAGGVMADQWKEYFYCEAMPANILATKGYKKTTGRSSNRRGDDNIITNGSMIAVADGQCMLIVEQGKVVEVCAEPGEFLYDTSTEPSIFSRGADAAEGAGILPQEPLAGGGLLAQFHRAGGICAGGLQEHPQVTLLDILGPCIGQHGEGVGGGGLVVVLRRCAGKVCQRQILLAPQPVPQELTVIGSHGPGPPQEVHGLHAVIGAFGVEVQRAQEARRYLLRGLQGQVPKFRQGGGQRFECNLHVSAILSLYF